MKKMSRESWCLSGISYIPRVTTSPESHLKAAKHFQDRTNVVGAAHPQRSLVAAVTMVKFAISIFLHFLYVPPY